MSGCTSVSITLVVDGLINKLINKKIVFCNMGTNAANSEIWVIRRLGSNFISVVPVTILEILAVQFFIHCQRHRSLTIHVQIQSQVREQAETIGRFPVTANGLYDAAARAFPQLEHSVSRFASQFIKNLCRQQQPAKLNLVKQTDYCTDIGYKLHRLPIFSPVLLRPSLTRLLANYSSHFAGTDCIHRPVYIICAEKTITKLVRNGLPTLQDQHISSIPESAACKNCTKR